jgi:F-type H+-transporting ATPase subunit epsilon
MRIEIYSLKRIVFEGEAKAVNCKTAIGQITVLDGHEPLISLLEEGSIIVTSPDGKEHHFPVKGGFLEVKATNTARFIVDE